MAGTVTTPKIVTTPETGTHTKAARPRLHKVVLLNDDFTPREFVVAVLKAVFRMTGKQAYGVMQTAHRRGTCVVAAFTRDVAETKAAEATGLGREAGYPLLFTTEPEDYAGLGTRGRHAARSGEVRSTRCRENPDAPRLAPGANARLHAGASSGKLPIQV